ncbi:MAG: ABC transporter substrate-binding protein [Alphaproteobacteria bacterium]
MSDARRSRKTHPWLPEMVEQLRRDEISRREFLRTATLLGISAGAACAMAGLPSGMARPALAAEPKRGGRFRMSMRVPEVRDPATFDWTEKSNVARHALEYLTLTGPDNLTRPYLAESWEPSDDLKTWTFHLRKDVVWSNGERFNADDVVHNFTRWLDPKVGSSNLGLFPGLTDDVDTGKADTQGKPIVEKRMRQGAVEKIDDHTVRLHLSSPDLALAENLYSYPAAIVHRRFDEEGGDFSKNPIGTGAFTLAEFTADERAVLKRRDGYWGGDAYLDEIVYIDRGEERAAWLAALAGGEVDAVFEVDVTQTDVVGGIRDAVLYEAGTARTGVARMQVDKPPFDDIRVRRAVIAAMDHRKLLDAAYRGHGMPGENHHVAPIHPDYATLPQLGQDHDLARKLLQEAGHGNGITLTIDVGNATGPWELKTVEALREQLAPAGITLEINAMSASRFWEIWDTTPFGFTPWAHRTLGVMVLNLGYRCGVPWNESHYCNPEFDKALDEANGILDANERRKAMVKVETILQQDAVIAQPFWQSTYSAATKNVKGYEQHPTQYHQFNRVWLS